jgi:serpin B
MTRKFSALAALLAAAIAAPAADRDLAPGLNRFSGALYGEAARGGHNFVLSPYSVSAALSMVFAGARGQTADEMRRVLGQTDGEPGYHAEFGALIDRIAKAANTGGNQFNAANSLWVQQGFSILPEFTGLLQSAYHAAPCLVDFEGSAEQARAAINSWTDRETRGKIHELFAPGAIKPDIRLVLGSAVYFNGKWERAFRTADTHPAEFTTASGAKAMVPFMHRTGRFGYAETAAGQTLEIRYAGNTGLAFDILLPKEGVKLESVERDFAQGKLSAWVGELKDREVSVAAPRFRVASETSLRRSLEALGMKTAFRSSADFSGIDDKRDLALADVVHKAWVDVTEEGTEAAAATGATMALVSMRMDPVPVFRADRPFVFLIRDTRSGLVLFAGRLLDPKP